jgi:AAA family ATPase
MSTFLVRPSNSEKEAFRAKLTAVSLLSLKLKSGDLCTIRKETVDGSTDVVDPKYAIVWENSSTGMKDNIVQTSKFLQDLHGLKLGDKVIIERAGNALQDAAVVQLRPRNRVEPLNDQQRKFWEYFAELTIKSSYECLAKTQKLSFKVGPELQEFEVVDTGVTGSGISRVTESTTYSIFDGSTLDTARKVSFNPTRLGGLQQQIREVQQLLERLLRSKISKRYAPTQGILLYGAKGVGKSLFIDELCTAGWTSILRWTPGTKVPSLTSSTLIVIDQLDLPSSQSGSKLVIREIDRLFATAKNKPCLIVGECRHPNDVDAYLRNEGKFSVEIEIPIPSAKQRKEILVALRGDEQHPDDTLVEQMASRTHGYVGADLHALLRRTLETASERPQDSDENLTSTEEAAVSAEPESWTVVTSDLDLALTQIRPSALQEIFLETPSTRWDDIGGQHTNKLLLQNAVERPLKMADRMAKLNLRPKKGVLLYGPPGCSKTLLVRALAREAGLNFLAVKGAELISMYVGESERATREVFRKARAASPSIVFFDEIDSIATRGRGGSGDNLNVLTTLLNEMDGFEELRNVFVVAATNKPEAIDPALMRPGRFDNVVYIGPPDLEARKEIFNKQFALSNYQSTLRGFEEDVWYFAEKTAGFSGAEIVAICQTAAELALDNDRDFYKFQDVEEAIRVTPRSITPEMLASFEAWNQARML